MGKIVPYLPSVAGFLAAAGLQVSGIQIPLLGYALMALSLGLLIIPGWKYIRRLRFRSPIVAGQNADGKISSAAALIQDNQSTEPDAPIVLRGFEFYPVRQQFDWFRKRVEEAAEVWALWCTCASVYNNGLLQSGHITRLILPHFGNAQLEEIAHVTNSQRDNLVRHITEVIDEAGKRGIESRLWLGHIPYNVTIGNPRANGMWVIIEPIVPFVGADQRPQVVVTHQTQPALCNRLRQSFLDMWADHSKHGA